MADRAVRMYNPNHRFDTSGEIAPTGDPTVAWSHEFQHVVFEVATWNESVYMAVGGSVVAVGKDGAPQWRFQTNSRVCSSSAVVNNTVYVGSGDNQIYALGGTEGEVHKEAEQTTSDTQVYQLCSDCGADLSGHDTVNFCPECGAEQ